jgi:hypothetical protein
MADQNNDGTPVVDPDLSSDDPLPDNQEPLSEDYLEDSVEDMERSFPDDNPEDAPAGGIEQFKEGVQDNLEGDSLPPTTQTDAGENTFDPSTFDTEENQGVDFKSADGGESVADKLDEEESENDPPADDSNIERRIG